MTLPAYQTCLQNAAYYLIPHPGFLKVSGEDRLAFLQRQTTNDLRSLTPGRTVSTVLTSSAARILDVFSVSEGTLPDLNPALDLISLPGQSEKTFRYLHSRIFFMDKVAVTDASNLYAQIDLLGPQIFNVLRMIGIKEPPEPNQVITGHKDGFQYNLIAQKGVSGPGYRLWIDRAAVESCTQAFESSGVPALSLEDYTILSVEAGIPQPSTELTEAFTPLEIGLTGSISMNKGCYTGQEIIARQVNYDKVTRHLSGLSLDAQVAPESTIYADDRPVGTVTSCVLSPRFGPIALSVLRRPYNEPSKTVTIGHEASSVRAIVTSLPFGDS